MGFLRDEASRLIRTKWGSNVDRAMEELYAIFTGDEPITIDSPVTIVNNTDGPPLTIQDYGNGDGGSIEIKKQPYPPPVFPDLPPMPDLQFGGVGGVQYLNIYPDGGMEGWSGDAGNPPTTTPGTGSQAGGGGVFPGKVTAGGPGDTYTVDVYEKGLSDPPTSRTVKQLSIDVSATIPANTWTLVFKSGADYLMQVPVWN